MEYLFNGCYSLISLPGISKWMLMEELDSVDREEMTLNSFQIINKKILKNKYK